MTRWEPSRAQLWIRYVCVSGVFGILPAAPLSYAQSKGHYHVRVLLTGDKLYIQHAMHEDKNMKVWASPEKSNVKHVLVSSRKVSTGP